jgi:hypothetical protein
MHPGANLSQRLCTLHAWRADASAAGPRRRGGMYRRRAPPRRSSSFGRRRESSGSPTPGRRRPRRWASAAPPSTGAFCRSSRQSRCRRARGWFPSTSWSGSSHNGAGLPERDRSKQGSAAPQRWRRHSFAASAPSVPPARALAKSPATSTQAGRRRPTAARSGGRRPFEPCSAGERDQGLPHSDGDSSRSRDPNFSQSRALRHSGSRATM